MDFLEKFLEDLRSVTTEELKVHGPEEALQPEDVVVGTVSENIKKLYVIVQRERELYNTQLANHEMLHLQNNGECPGDSEVIHAGHRVSQYHNLLWFMVNYEMGFPNTECGLGLREGWLVVLLKPEASNMVTVEASEMFSLMGMTVLGANGQEEEPADFTEDDFDSGITYTGPGSSNW